METIGDTLLKAGYGVQLENKCGNVDNHRNVRQPGIHVLYSDPEFNCHSTRDPTISIPEVAASRSALREMWQWVAGMHPDVPDCKDLASGFLRAYSPDGTELVASIDLFSIKMASVRHIRGPVLANHILTKLRTLDMPLAPCD